MKRRGLQMLLIPLLTGMCVFGSLAGSGYGQGLAPFNQELIDEGYTRVFADTNVAGEPLNRALLAGDWKGVPGPRSELEGRLGAPLGPIIVYGTPSADGRYLGKTQNGELFTNFLFPHDAWDDSLKLEQRRWVENPVRAGLVKQIYPDESYNAQSPQTGDRFLKNILGGLALYYGDVIDPNSKAFLDAPWHMYMHVLQPPTTHAWGMGRMWHQRADGSFYYITVPLVPDALLEAPQNIMVTMVYKDLQGALIGKEEQAFWPLAPATQKIQQLVASKAFKGYTLKKVTAEPGIWDQPPDVRLLTASNQIQVRYDASVKAIRLVCHYEPLCDLSVRDIVPVRVPGNKEVLLSVYVMNDSKRARLRVPVSLEIAGKLQSQPVDLPPQAMTKVYFRWISPKGPARVPAIARVNESKSIQEIRYDNNTQARTIQVLETAKESFPSTSPFPAHAIPKLPSYTDNSSVTWQELRYSHTDTWTDAEGNSYSQDVFVWKTFYARLSLKIQGGSGQMKSGYGFSLKVIPELTTDYDRPLSPPQSITMAVPEYYYRPQHAVSLEQVSGAFVLPPNARTPILARKWYVPVWFPDGRDYQVALRAFDCDTPGGALTASGTAVFQIQGHMYEDDWTGSR